jgi:L-iditol 2-dehydrogenase
VAVKHAGICGSDLHIYHGDVAIPVRPPVIIGHEFSGTVGAVGADVTGWEVGARVSAETAASRCDKCRYCRSGRYNVCPDRRTLGYWYDGAFAPFVVVPARNLHRLPATVDFLAGAMTEPAACCVHAVVEQTSVRAGEDVLIIGPGTMGLICAQLAQSAGARVIVAGTAVDEPRLAVARELGAAETVAVSDGDACQQVLDLTGGAGPDVVFECSGTAAGCGLGLAAVRRRGRFTQVGLFGGPVTVDFERISYKELKVTGALGSVWTSWETALAFMADGRLRLAPLASEPLPLTAWAEGFRRFERKDGLSLS